MFLLLHTAAIVVIANVAAFTTGNIPTIATPLSITTPILLRFGLLSGLMYGTRLTRVSVEVQFSAKCWHFVFL